MADSAVVITSGTGTNIDTRTEATNGNHRQVVVLGDPATNAGVAPVDATAGLKVDLGTDNDITGTVTANLSATDNAVLDDIAAKLATIDADTSALAAGVSTEYQVDVVTSALPTGAATSAKQDTIIGHVDGIETVLGTIDTDTGNIATATQLLDDTVYTDDADWTDDTSKHLLVGGVYQSSPHTVTDGDVTPFLTDANGRLVVAATDNGSSLTVDGTVTANLSATDNAVLDNIDADTSAIQTATEAIQAAVEGTVAVSNTGLTELAAAINSSKVDVNIVSSDVATGGTSAADDADFTAGTTTGTPAQGVYESSPTSVTDGDLGTVGITQTRALKVQAQANGGVDIGDVTINNATIAVTQSGTWDEVGINDSGNSITVDANNLDIRDIDKASDDILIYANTAKDGSGTSYVPLTDTDGHLQVDVLSGGGGGTQYTQGDTDSTITGTAMMFEASNDTLDVVSDSTPLPVNIISSNSITVEDGGGAITVDGTVDLGATDNAVLDAIAASVAAIDTDTTTIIGHVDGIETVLGTIDTDTGNISTKIDTVAGAVSGSEMQVDIVSAPTITVTATNLDVQSGGADLATSAQGAAIQTAVETIDNAISGSEMQVDVVGALPAGTNAIGKLAANSGVDIGDVTLTAGTAAIGTLLPPDIDVTTHTNYAKKYYTNAGAVTDGIIWSPAAGKRWHVVSMIINTSAAATVTLEDDKAGGDEAVMKMELAANSGVAYNFTEHYPLASGEDAADLIVTTSAGNIYITVVGYEI